MMGQWNAHDGSMECSKWVNGMLMMGQWNVHAGLNVATALDIIHNDVCQETIKITVTFGTVTVRDSLHIDSNAAIQYRGK
jgi:hypothetical protein